MKLAPYPEYKDSGVPWLGKIPAHWEVHPLKRMAKNILETTTEKNFLELYVALEHIESKTGNLRKNYEGHFSGQVKRFSSEDVLFGKLRPYLAKVALPMESGVCVGEILAIRPNGDLLNKLFLSNVMLSHRFIDIVNSSTYGAKMPRAEWTFIGNLGFPLLPAEEQTQIARFLDWKTAQINKFIRNKRRLIELLKEQKQNVINRAVTRGLDPSVKLKPSGVEWIGDIPEHWTVAPLKHLASINARVLPESTDQNYKFKYFDISSVGTGCLSGEPETLCFGQAPSRARRILKKGDTILSTVRTYLKAVYYVSDEVEDWIASTGFAALTPKEAIHPPFLGLVIQSDNFINRVIQESTGVAYPAIAETKLGTLHLAYPESIEEQQAILEHITDSSKAIDQAITRAEREIELMREYRTRLISDVVTGQVDVRGIEVPEVAEEELLALEEDTADADDLIDDEGDMDEFDR